MSLLQRGKILGKHWLFCIKQFTQAWLIMIFVLADDSSQYRVLG